MAMDLTNGQFFDSIEDAKAAGVPESDLALVQARLDAKGRIDEIVSLCGVPQTETDRQRTAGMAWWSWRTPSATSRPRSSSRSNRACA